MLSLAGLVSELVTDIIRTTKPAIWFSRHPIHRSEAEQPVGTPLLG